MRNAKRLFEMSVLERIATSDAYAVPVILEKPKKPKRLSFQSGEAKE